MSFLSSFFGLLKKLVLFVLIVAIAIPFHYGSTNVQHLRIRLIHSVLSLKYTFTPDNARPDLSAAYLAFENIISHKPLGKLDPTVDLSTVIKGMRSRFFMGNLVPKPSQCQVEKNIFEHDGHQVNTYWIDHHFNAQQTTPDRLLIYLHGGGYMMGDIHSYSGLECHLSRLFNVTVLHVEYRLSPEHPLSAAVQDSVALYRSLLQRNISPSQLMLMGDSAGGGLSLLTVQALISNGIPVPRGVITLSAWADLSASGESYKTNREIDVMLGQAPMGETMVSLIMGTNPSKLSANDPSFSPVFGSFKGFPPMYVNVGTAEILADDSRSVVKKAQEADVNVTFEIGQHLMHVYPIFYLYYPEARQSLDNIKKWIDSIYQ